MNAIFKNRMHVSQSDGEAAPEPEQKEEKEQEPTTDAANKNEGTVRDYIINILHQS